MNKLWRPQGQSSDQNNETEKVLSQSLDNMRTEIDSIDDQLSQLLLRRFEIAKEIASEKARMGRQLKDSTREQEVIDRLSRKLSGAESRDCVLSVFKALFTQSIKFQEIQIEQKVERVRNEKLFPTICIIGAGLIGGALARQIKQTFPKSKLFAIDLKKNIPLLAKSGLFEECAENTFDSITANSSTQDLADADMRILKNSSLVVLSCPPETSVQVLKQISSKLSPGQIVIDLCSIKSPICQAAEELDLQGAQFIGAHPFFGNEKAGFENSDTVEMFNKTFCLTPTSSSTEFSVARLKRWLSSMKFRVFITDAQSHDRTVAMTSHVIQLLASALGSTIFEELGENDPGNHLDHLALSGGALAGFSRLMSSPVGMWHEISVQNRNEIQKVLSKLILKMQSLCTAESATGSEFQSIFEDAAMISKGVQK